MPDNVAAWILESRARFTVKEAPYTKPQPTEVVIEAHAVAANPLDYKFQDYDPIPNFPIKYPTVFGSDVAGVVVELGSEVKDVAVGDRVMAHQPPAGPPWIGAFQKYVVSRGVGVIPIPEHISFAEAAVLPLSGDTALTGLYYEEFLGLQMPSRDAKPVDKTLLVWGGSSSVGCSVIQMAVASGYDVVAVASQHNHELCSSLGAREVFDYADANIVSTIVAALHGRELAGAFDCIADHEKTILPCAQILTQSKGSKKVMSVLTPGSTGIPEDVTCIRVYIPKMLATPGFLIMRKWIEEALKERKLLPKPDPQVVGHGLEHVQLAVDTLRKGVSGTKLVVTL